MNIAESLKNIEDEMIDTPIYSLDWKYGELLWSD